MNPTTRVLAMSSHQTPKRGHPGKRDFLRVILGQMAKRVSMVDYICFGL